MISEPYLKEIFLENTEAAVAELHEVRQKKKWDKEFEHDVMIAFWLAVHMENIELT